MILSSLVVCAIILGTVATFAFDGFSLGGDSDDTDTNWEDPNADLIGEQQTMVAENPDDFASVALLANLLANTNRVSEAIPYFEQALDMRPDDIGTRLDFARSLADGSLPNDAEVQFLEVLKRDPENQQAHYYLAELYRTWNPARTDEAIPHYQRAVEIDPTSYIGQQSLAQLESLGAATPSASPTDATPDAIATPS